MSEWKKVKLDDCLELITYGFTNPMPDTLSGPWKVTAKDINNGRIVFETARHTSQDAFDLDLTDKSRPKKGDILLTKDGTLGRLAIVGDERICINQSVALLRVKKDILSVSYLYYLLSTPLYQAKMLADAGGAAIKHIYITRVNQLMIPFPSYDKQCRIATILSRYDSLIENYQKQIKLLEEAAQRLYKEWFIDLRFPGHENTKIVDGVPEGWEKKPISQLGEYLNGFAFKPSDWQESGKPIIKIKEMGNGVGNDTPRNNGEHVPAKYLIKSGDLLFSWSATLMVIVWSGEDGWLNQHLFKVTPVKGIGREFLLQSISNTIEEFQNLTTGSTMKHIQRNKLDQVFVNVPNSEIMKLYSSKAEKLREEILHLSSQIRLLTEARDRLLPKLMNGDFNIL